MSQHETASTLRRSLALIPAVLVQLIAHSLYADEISQLARTCRSLFDTLDCAFAWSHVPLQYVHMDKWSSTFIRYPFPAAARWQPVEVSLGDCRGGHNMQAMLEVAASCRVVRVETRSDYEWCHAVRQFFSNADVRAHLRVLHVRWLNCELMEVLDGCPNLAELRSSRVDFPWLIFDLPSLTSLTVEDTCSMMDDLTHFERLQILSISNPQIAAADLLTCFESMAPLTQLTLQCWKQELLDTISPSLLSEGFAMLRSLHRLTFSHCGRIHCNLSVLPASLDELVVHVTPVSESALRHLLSSHPALRISASSHSEATALCAEERQMWERLVQSCADRVVMIDCPDMD